MRRRRPRPLGIRYRITSRASKRAEPVDELRDISQRVHMRIWTVQFRAPCPTHTFRFREFHKVMDLVTVAFPSVKSSAVKSDDTDKQEAKWVGMGARLKYNDGRGGRQLGRIVVSAVYLHFSTWCEHVLHRRLRLRSVHVDNLFDAVHPQAILERVKIEER